MNGRGQTFTLEAVVAGILLLVAVGFALQVVSISANSASVGDLELRNQHAGLAEGVMDAGVANGSLEATVLYWDEVDEEFYDTDNSHSYYIARPPPTNFGDALDEMFGDRQVRYNINLYYRTESGDRHQQRVVDSGAGNDNAVRVVETITVYDYTPLVNNTESPRAVTLADVDTNPNGTFYAPDAHPTGELYNVFRVEIILWQT